MLHYHSVCNCVVIEFYNNKARHRSLLVGRKIKMVELIQRNRDILEYLGDKTW